MDGNNSWFINMLKLFSYAFNSNTFDKNKRIFPTSDSLKCNLKYKFKTWWSERLFDDSKSEHGNKLRNYRTYKYVFIKEQYLNVVTSKVLRSKFAQLRLSCHKLEIEMGRYVKPRDKKVPKDRICRYCTLNDCEDEFHFLLKCNCYMTERSKFLNDLQLIFPHIQLYEDKRLYTWLMGNMNKNVILLLSKYIYSCFLLRSNHIS